MLSSTVLCYSTLRVKRSNLPKSPHIFLRLFTENTHILLTPCNHPKISQHSYTSCHAWRKQCVLANYTQNYNIPIFFLFYQKQKQRYKAVICVRMHSLVSSYLPWISAKLGWWDLIMLIPWLWILYSDIGKKELEWELKRMKWNWTQVCLLGHYSPRREGGRCGKWCASSDSVSRPHTQIDH